MKKLKKRKVSVSDSVMAFASCDTSCPSCVAGNACGSASDPLSIMQRAYVEQTRRVQGFEGVRIYYGG